MMKWKKPFMSSGKLVRDYRPLLKYLDLLPPRDREKTLPSEDDFKFVESQIIKEPRKLDELIRELSGRKASIVNKKLAVEAVMKAWGMNVDEGLAVREISGELAGWILEICDALGIVRINLK